MKPEVISLSVVAASMITIVLWSVVTWRLALPTSKSHELVASLTGAGLAAAGSSVLLWGGWEKVLIGLVLSTFGGFLAGGLFMIALDWILRRNSPASVRGIFSRLQIASSAFMAFSHGSNDGQKFMGVFALALLIGGAATSFHVSWWIILICGTVMGLGTIFGGWRIMRTVGFKLTKLEPVNGFAAETAGGAAITLASSFGIPLSTTHTINTAIMGVGATRRLSAVHWEIAKRIVAAWILTFPAMFRSGLAFKQGPGPYHVKAAPHSTSRQPPTGRLTGITRYSRITIERLGQSMAGNKSSEELLRDIVAIELRMFLTVQTPIPRRARSSPRPSS